MIRGAIVGLGPHGMRMFQSARNIKNIEIVAVVDHDETKFQQLALRETDAVRLKDVGKLWEHKIQLLMVATNGPSHVDVSLEGIRHGITHLLVSKPMSCSIGEAIAINDAAKRNNVRLCVDHILRYDSTYRWIKMQMRDGQWGRLRSIYLQRPGIGLGCLGVHSFDLANFLIGSTPNRVTGWIDKPIGKNPRGEQFVDPGGMVVLEYDNNLRAIVDQIEDGSGPPVTEMIFNYARVRIDEKNGILEVVEKDKNFVPAPDKKAQLKRYLNPHNLEVKHDMILLLEKLLRELIGAGKITADGSSGQKTIEILVAAYISQQNNNIPVQLPLQIKDQLNLTLNIT